MTKLVWTVSILLLGLAAVARGQETSSSELSSGDKTKIIEAVLDLESGGHRTIPYTDDGKRWRVSSENIEFIDPSLLWRHGFSSSSAKYIVALKKDGVVKYLRFNQVLVRDGAAVVTLSLVTEGRGCFGSVSNERKYAYKARQTSVGWIAELTQGPAGPLSSPRPSFSRKDFVWH
ncbi:MAG TPA: hypothetical protein VE961_11975 [Pyrinomonadaceae bacterium]|nr:hypothetical protein [Pyrinomonadaceae bacterium]